MPEATATVDAAIRSRARPQRRARRRDVPPVPREPATRSSPRLARLLRRLPTPPTGDGARSADYQPPAPRARPRRRPAPAAPAPAAGTRRRGNGTRPDRARRRDAASRCAARRPASSRTWRRASASRPRRRCARCPAKLLEVNRQILNNHLARTGGGKVSFTHLIGFAVLRALRRRPGHELRASASIDGKPERRAPRAREPRPRDRPCRSPTARARCSCPNIKDADTLDFAAFHAAYEDLDPRGRARTSSRPTTSPAPRSSITNPGTIGTMHSVPRLMPGQGVIVGVGAIAYPARVRGRRPADARRARRRARSSRSRAPTTTASSRARRAASSSRRVHDLLLGGDGFYDDIFASLGVPYEPARWSPDRSPLAGLGRGAREGHRGAAAHQHVPRARAPDRQPRPARPEGAAHAPRARPEPLGPHDLGPRPRVPHRRPRGPVDA